MSISSRTEAELTQIYNSLEEMALFPGRKKKTDNSLSLSQAPPSKAELDQILKNAGKLELAFCNHHARKDADNITNLPQASTSNKNDTEFYQLFKDNLQVSNTPLVDWSDDFFRSTYQSKLKWYGIPSKDVQIKAAKSMLYYYFVEPATEQELTKCLELLLMSMCAKDMSPAIPSDFQTKDSAPVPINIERIDEALLGITSVATPYPAQPSHVQPGLKDTKAWIQIVLNILNQTGTPVPTEKDRLAITNLILYIMIICTRHCTKDAKDVNHHIVMKATEKARSFWNVPPNVTASPPPTAACSYAIKGYFTQFSTQSTIWISRLISLLMTEPRNDIVDAVLLSGCMLNLAYTGLGVVYFLMRAYRVQNWPISDMLNYLAFDRTLHSLKMLAHFGQSMSCQVSWKWSRLLHKEAFVDLATKNHRLLVAFLTAVCCNADRKDPIWSSVQLAPVLIYKEQACDYASTMITLRKQ